jgi:hypothetical protein
VTNPLYTTITNRVLEPAIGFFNNRSPERESATRVSGALPSREAAEK